jgi:hypothetical protein
MNRAFALSRKCRTLHDDFLELREPVRHLDHGDEPPHDQRRGGHGTARTWTPTADTGGDPTSATIRNSPRTNDTARPGDPPDEKDMTAGTTAYMYAAACAAAYANPDANSPSTHPTMGALATSRHCRTRSDTGDATRCRTRSTGDAIISRTTCSDMSDMSDTPTHGIKHRRRLL